MKAVRLGDHAKLIRGITFKPVDKCEPFDEGTVVCMRTKNVQTTLDASDLIAVPSSVVKNSEKLLSAGDILVSSANSRNLVGKCCQVPRLQYPSTAGSFISILRPKTEKLDSSFLYRWFSSDVVQRKLRSFANQTTNISNLDHKRTLELQVPFPSLAEQKRIAAILDAADALQAKRREALAQLDTLLQSIFLDMFGDPVNNPLGWGMATVGEVTTCLDRLRQPVKEADRVDGKVPYYGANGQQGWIRGALFDEPLVLVAEDGGHFGDPARGVAYRIDGPSWVNNHAHVLRPATAVDVEYLHRALRHYDFGPYISGSTRAKLNQAQLNKARLALPPPDLQHRFAEIVQSVERQKARQRIHLVELDTLFASLQSRAFRGDL